jgi:hypothetical protein
MGLFLIVAAVVEAVLIVGTATAGGGSCDGGSDAGAS